MDKIKYKQATINDIDLLIKLRMDCILEINPCNNISLIEKMKIATKQYFIEYISKGQLFGFLGSIEKKIICGACLLIFTLPPLINSKNRIQGHIQNCYTYPDYRKKGYGKGLMDFIIKTARSKKINILFLHTTEMGKSLYEKSGFFEPENKEMILNL